MFGSKELGEEGGTTEQGLPGELPPLSKQHVKGGSPDIDHQQKDYGSAGERGSDSCEEIWQQRDIEK